MTGDEWPGEANLGHSISRLARLRPFMPLQIGDVAPEFELPSHTGQRVKLSEFRGSKNVVLAFFVLANTPT